MEVELAAPQGFSESSARPSPFMGMAGPALSFVYALPFLSAVRPGLRLEGQMYGTKTTAELMDCLPIPPPLRTALSDRR